MTLTFLGTGTSTGVPQIGCPCPVCTSSDPRDRRLRTSALVETDDAHRILIDCGPDFREQMLRVPFGKLDAVLITHEHYDHVGGIDDLRPFCKFGDIHLYADSATSSALRMRLSYCFAEHLYPGVPRLVLHTLHSGTPFTPFEGTELTPLRVLHGRLPILGYRIGPLLYITDMSTLPAASLPFLRGVRTLVVNALRLTPHPSHQSIDEAIAFAQHVGAEQTYFTHMSHQAPRHDAFQQMLPKGMYVAYDGLTIQV